MKNLTFKSINFMFINNKKINFHYFFILPMITTNESFYLVLIKINKTMTDFNKKHLNDII